MKSFKEFLKQLEEQSGRLLPSSDETSTNSQTALAIRPEKDSTTNKKKVFTEKVNNLIQDEAFLSKYSDKIGEPLENESEDDFVKRASDILREDLYKKFGIKK